MKKRVTSAVVLLAVVLVCVLLSSYTRLLFFTACGIICAYELCKNFETLEIYCGAWVMYLYLCVQSILALIGANTFLYIAWFVFCVYLTLFRGIISRKIDGKGAVYSVFGMMYPCLLFGIMTVIAVTDYWKETLILGCASAWICDSFALFGGIRFGKHKVAPHVSPNKSVEGCICGAIASLFAGVVVFFIFQHWTYLPMWLCVSGAFLASTMGQIGDLAESLVKRMIGIKDFSNLIPGHGGMFDRADSLMFSIPTAFACIHAFYTFS